MYKKIRLSICLSLLFIFSFFGCTSTVKAPVDSRTKTPTADNRGSNRQASDKSPAGQQRDYHIVIEGDTMYSIAWRYGHDYRDIARWNDISGKYVIYPGQFIRLKPDSKKASSLQPGPIVARKKTNLSSDESSKPASAATKSKPTRSRPGSPRGKIAWQWPTKGKIVKLNTPSSKKGVDIAGRAGQQVNAAAAGEVVYSGSGLLGYGKLIIIKHNDTFLSAYAHNEKIHAKEGDRVKAGQQIATMGLGNKGQPILHFEIREDGTPVNPLQHLPRDRS